MFKSPNLPSRIPSFSRNLPTWKGSKRNPTASIRNRKRQSSEKKQIPPQALNYREVLGLTQTPPHRITYFLDREELLSVRQEFCRAIPTWKKIGVSHIALGHLFFDPPNRLRVQNLLTQITDPQKRSGVRSRLKMILWRAMRGVVGFDDTADILPCLHSYVDVMEMAQKHGINILGIAPPPMREVVFENPDKSSPRRGRPQLRDSIPLKKRVDCNEDKSIDYTVRAWVGLLQKALRDPSSIIIVLAHYRYLGYHWSGGNFHVNQVFRDKGEPGNVVQFIGGRPTPTGGHLFRDRTERAARTSNIHGKHFVMTMPSESESREIGSDHIIHLPQT